MEKELINLLRSNNNYDCNGAGGGAGLNAKINEGHRIEIIYFGKR